MDERTFQINDFAVTRSTVGTDKVRVVWKGTFQDLTLPPELIDLLGIGTNASFSNETEGEGSGETLRSIELRFEELVSINSSMMVYLTRFVRELGLRTPRLAIHYNPQVEFQEVLFPIIAETVNEQNPDVSVEIYPETGTNPLQGEGGHD